MSSKRCFLFLQGPQSRFFRWLGLALTDLGHKVIKINFCGGDVLHWPRPYARVYQGRRTKWPLWVDRLLQSEQVTDLLLFGDRRPMHRDALFLAAHRGIDCHVFEEGYLRPAHITMETNGVNGCSSLPRTPQMVRDQAQDLPPAEFVQPLPNPLKKRVLDAVWHHVGNTLLMPAFPLYRTHRPYTIAWELQGWIPRYLNRKQRASLARQKQEQILDQGLAYYLFPLQLDSDFQIRLYSSFSNQTETIMHVLSSFAASAPQDTYLVLKNHPLDNGLINYQRFSLNFARALGIEHRVYFLDGGDGGLLMQSSRGVVLVNSTMGLEALTMGLPVYCLGQAIYSMPGLAVTHQEQSLDSFWQEPRPPDQGLLQDYVRVLLDQALVYGNFYTDRGIEAAVQGSLQRLLGSSQ